jgi:hypothetical protein
MATGFPIIFGGGGSKLWTPEQISTALWLDAADSSTIILNGSTVSQWNDKSGNNRHAVQATASAQPTRTVTQNGNLTLTADGNDWFIVQNSIGAPIDQEEFLVFLFAKIPAGTSQREVIGNRTATGGRILRLPVSGGTSTQMANINAGNVLLTHTMTNFSGYSGRVTAGGGLTFDINGGALTGTGIGGYFPSSGNLMIFGPGDIGAGGWIGDMAEIIWCSSVLSQSNYDRVWGYAAHRWWGPGGANPLPAGHPYKNFPPTV